MRLGADVSTMNALVSSAPPTFDALGHCTHCHLGEVDIARADAVISGRIAFSVVRYPVCGHIMLYRKVRT